MNSLLVTIHSFCSLIYSVFGALDRYIINYIVHRTHDDVQLRKSFIPKTKVCQ